MLIGLTGGIGSGKTSVAGILAEKGFYIIDADKISKTIYLSGKECYYRLIEAFGQDILGDDLEIDRKKLKEKAFISWESKKLLEQITHKYILEEMLRQKALGHEKGFSHIVFDAPQLIESGLHEICDKVIVVDAPACLRINRIKNRDFISDEDIKKIITMQKTINEFKEYADYIIVNDGDFKRLLEAVDTITLNIK